MVALARGDRQAAEGLFTRASSSPYAHKTATAQLATLARARGDTAAAARYEKEAAGLSDDPPWPDPLLDRVVRLQVGKRGRSRQVALLERERRFAEAAQVYLDQLEEERTADACVGAGLNLARLRDYDRALPLLREGVQLAPDSARAHNTLAVALFSQAEREWQHAPGSPRLLASFREAVQMARRATELRPDLADAYLNWGLALKYLGKPAEAVAPLRQGVACRPTDFELQLALGQVLVEIENYREAKTHLENARQLDGTDPRPGQALARLRRK
jgi:Flp pilus assembly protein TadD